MARKKKFVAFSPGETGIRAALNTEGGDQPGEKLIPHSLTCQKLQSARDAFLNLMPCEPIYEQESKEDMLRVSMAKPEVEEEGNPPKEVATSEFQELAPFKLDEESDFASDLMPLRVAPREVSDSSPSSKLRIK